MKNVNITEEMLIKHFPEMSGKIMSILSQKDFQYSNQKSIRNFIKKSVIGYLLTNTDELASQLETSIMKPVIDYENYGGFSIEKVSLDKVLLLNAYLGIFTQGKKTDGANVYYRYDKIICVYYEFGNCIVSFNKKKVDAEAIRSNIFSIFNDYPTELDSEKAVEVIYRAESDSVNENEHDKSSGFSNKVINSIIEETLDDSFAINLQYLLAIRNMSYKSFDFYNEGFKNLDVVTFGDFSVKLTEEKISELKGLEYIDEFFNLLEKGRLAVALCYLNFPALTLGTSRILNINKELVSGSIKEHNSDVISFEGKLYLKRSAFKDKIDSALILDKTDSSTPFAESMDERKGVYLHSERLNYANENGKTIIKTPIFSNDKLNFYAVSNTYVSNFRSEVVYGCSTLLFNFVYSAYPNSDMKTDGHYIYFYNQGELIAAISCFIEPFNEFNLMTQFEYSSYSSSIKDAFAYANTGLQYAKGDAIRVNTLEAQDDLGIADNFTIKSLYDIDAQSGYSVNILGAYRKALETKSTSMIEYLSKFESDRQIAISALNDFVKDSPESEFEKNQLLNKQVRHIHNIQKMIENG